MKEISIKLFGRDEKSTRFPQARVTDIGMKNLAKSLKNLTSLQKLTLEFDLGKYGRRPSFSDQGMKSLSQALRKLVSLKSVQIKIP